MKAFGKAYKNTNPEDLVDMDSGTHILFWYLGFCMCNSVKEVDIAAINSISIEVDGVISDWDIYRRTSFIVVEEMSLLGITVPIY